MSQKVMIERRLMEHLYRKNFLLLFITGLLISACSLHTEEKIADNKPAPASKKEATDYSDNDLPVINVAAPAVQNDTSLKADLKGIKERGKLIALTGYSYTSYFIYKGTPMGYEYELLDRLAKELGVSLEIVVVDDMDKIFRMLQEGKGDIIADNLAITKEREEQVDFTEPHNTTRQVLVQRLPEGHKSMTDNEIENKIIRNPLDLLGKKVHVRRNSAFHSRLKNLSEEIGGNIDIVPVEGSNDTEHLIRKVAEGKIDYTVAEENVAKVNKSYYSNLDISTPVSFPQRVAWAVREDCPELRAEVNKWILDMKQKPVYYTIYNKYYKALKGVNQQILCSKQSTCGTKISDYDELLVQHAERINWDWRLLSSLVYQESGFNPRAKSWAGASGLMQLMPRTAEYFGAKNPENPEQCVRAGTEYLSWLENYWKDKVSNPEERIKFILASYNVGQEHVADAQRLAKKYGKDPEVWDGNVAECLLMKSTEKYCNDPVVQYGYCRGREPYNYVQDILERYEHYKKLIKKDAYADLAVNDKPDG